MSDAFVYFYIIGAGLALGVVSVALPTYYFIFKKGNNKKVARRGDK